MTFNSTLSEAEVVTRLNLAIGSDNRQKLFWGKKNGTTFKILTQPGSRSVRLIWIWGQIQVTPNGTEVDARMQHNWFAYAFFIWALGECFWISIHGNDIFFGTLMILVLAYIVWTIRWEYRLSKNNLTRVFESI